jgi:hypothetical protein
VFSAPLSYAVSHWTLASRYEVYENGAFTLSYSGGRPYIGKYSRDNEHFVFDFGSGEGAKGTARGDLLEVRYDVRMQMSDFEDAVYKRSQ